MASLVESLRLGSEALRFSVDQLESDLKATAAASDTARSGASLGILGAFGLALFAALTDDDRAPLESASLGERKRGTGTWLMAVVAIAFFVALPQAAAAGVDRALGLRPRRAERPGSRRSPARSS